MVIWNKGARFPCLAMALGDFGIGKSLTSTYPYSIAINKEWVFVT